MPPALINPNFKPMKIQGNMTETRMKLLCYSTLLNPESCACGGQLL